MATPQSGAEDKALDAVPLGETQFDEATILMHATQLGGGGGGSAAAAVAAAGADGTAPAAFQPLVATDVRVLGNRTHDSQMEALRDPTLEVMEAVHVMNAIGVRHVREGEEEGGGEPAWPPASVRELLK